MPMLRPVAMTLLALGTGCGGASAVEAVVLLAERVDDRGAIAGPVPQWTIRGPLSPLVPRQGAICDPTNLGWLYCVLDPPVRGRGWP